VLTERISNAQRSLRFSEVFFCGQRHSAGQGYHALRQLVLSTVSTVRYLISKYLGALNRLA
jgi:hypothetical protein